MLHSLHNVEESLGKIRWEFGQSELVHAEEVQFLPCLCTDVPMYTVSIFAKVYGPSSVFYSGKHTRKKVQPYLWAAHPPRQPRQLSP